MLEVPAVAALLLPQALARLAHGEQTSSRVDRQGRNW